METVETKLELHYWFNDNSHTMDAYTLNNCERELLNLIKQIGVTLEVEVDIEVAALEEGGLRQLFRIIKKKEKKNGVITIALISAILTATITAPITSTITEAIHKLFEDEEIVDLEKQKLKEEIKNFMLKNEILENELNTNAKILKKKSNFYNCINTYPKITKVSFTNKSNEQSLFNEAVVKRSEFTNYILVSDDLPAKIDENAVIEIVSPVLKKGKYKWKGIYNGIVLDFNMKSNEFKTLIQSGLIEFKNGTSITCILEMPCKMDSSGNEIITSYNIITVLSYFNNDTMIETPEGQFVKRKKEADEQQLRLTFED